MIFYLLIWFVSSIIVSLLLAQFIGKGSRMTLDEEDSFEYGDWYVKNITDQHTFWDKNKNSARTMLNSDLHLKNNDKMRVSLN